MNEFCSNGKPRRRNRRVGVRAKKRQRKFLKRGSNAGGRDWDCSKVDTKQQSNCRFKKQFSDQWVAAEAGKRIVQRKDLHYPLFTYLCDMCGKWHLTKSPPNGKVSDTKHNLKQLQKLKDLMARVKLDLDEAELRLAFASGKLVRADREFKNATLAKERVQELIQKTQAEIDKLTEESK